MLPFGIIKIKHRPLTKAARNPFFIEALYQINFMGTI
jgi:hypothetical protein